MQKTNFEPWTWGKNTNAVKSVEVNQPPGTLYCSGKAPIDPNGISSSSKISTRLIQAISNLEQLIRESNYECKNIVPSYVCTSNKKEFFSNCSDVYASFLIKHGIPKGTTLLEVKGLFATRSEELEAPVMK